MNNRLIYTGVTTIHSDTHYSGCVTTVSHSQVKVGRQWTEIREVKRVDTSPLPLQVGESSLQVRGPFNEH